MLRGFDDVKVYYDCGQKQITNMLHLFFESRKDIPVRFAQAVEPRKYKLFQLADLACTIKLLELKLKTEGRLSPCERRFFGAGFAFWRGVSDTSRQLDTSRQFGRARQLTQDRRFAIIPTVRGLSAEAKPSLRSKALAR